MLGGLLVLALRLRGLPRDREARKWAILIFVSIIAYFPALLRAGPEAYKALLMEGLAIPLSVVFLATFLAGSNKEHGWK